MVLRSLLRRLAVIGNIYSGYLTHTTLTINPTLCCGRNSTTKQQRWSICLQNIVLVYIRVCTSQYRQEKHILNQIAVYFTKTFYVQTLISGSSLGEGENTAPTALDNGAKQALSLCRNRMNDINISSCALI